ncbi:hypothetical protein OIV42_32935, partial [Burkholderia pseudomallei]|nr:hypothetical protein [Burkholderia pseudomallei]
LSPGTRATESLRAVAAWGARGHVRLHAAVQADVRSFVISKELSLSEEVDQASAGLGAVTTDEPTRTCALELPVQFDIDTVARPIPHLSPLARASLFRLCRAAVLFIHQELPPHGRQCYREIDDVACVESRQVMHWLCYGVYCALVGDCYIACPIVYCCVDSDVAGTF